MAVECNHPRAHARSSTHTKMCAFLDTATSLLPGHAHGRCDAATRAICAAQIRSGWITSAIIAAGARGATGAPV
jgi:hypothetical protein